MRTPAADTGASTAAASLTGTLNKGRKVHPIIESGFAAAGAKLREILSSSKAIAGEERGRQTCHFICVKLSPGDSLPHVPTIAEWALERAAQGVFTREQAALWVEMRQAWGVNSAGPMRLPRCQGA